MAGEDDFSEISFSLADFRAKENELRLMNEQLNEKKAQLIAKSEAALKRQNDKITQKAFLTLTGHKQEGSFQHDDEEEFDIEEDIAPEEVNEKENEFQVSKVKEETLAQKEKIPEKRSNEKKDRTEAIAMRKARSATLNPSASTESKSAAASATIAALASAISKPTPKQSKSRTTLKSTAKTTVGATSATTTSSGAISTVAASSPSIASTAAATATIGRKGHPRGSAVPLQQLSADESPEIFSSSSSSSSLSSSSSSSTSASDSASVPLDFDDLPADLAPSAAIRLYRAKLSSMTESSRKLQSDYQRLEVAFFDCSTKLKSSTEELKKLKKSASGAESEKEDSKKLIEDLQKKLNALEKEKERIRLDNERNEKGKKQLESELKMKDLKLNRALADLERFRSDHSDGTGTSGTGNNEENETLRDECDRLRSDKKRLIQQRNELIGAFKKQMKLIDILKKQKLHLEAARLLAFTEEEFAKTLETGGE